MRVVFAGTPQVALPALEALLGSSHEVVAAVTRPDAAAGRGRRVSVAPVAARAREAGVPLLQPQRPSEPQFLDALRELAPDCCPVVAYGSLVPRAALDVPRHGWVNLHFSLLPAWRGAAPVQRAVMAGDEVTGACTFLLEEGLDTGPVLGRLEEPVGPRDTAGELLERLALRGAQLLVRTLDELEAGTAVAEPQPAEGASAAPKLSPAEARVDWTQEAAVVDRRVRGCTPAPGAWTTLREQRLKLGPVLPVDVTGAAPAPGELLVERERVLVGTGRGVVELGEVQPAGKRAMPAPAWARGTRLDAGERLA